MFRPSPVLHGTIRRLPLSPKQAGKEYYKGNRVGSLGVINRFGNFTPDWSKIRTYVYPVHGVKNAEVRPLPSLPSPFPSLTLSLSHLYCTFRPPDNNIGLADAFFVVNALRRANGAKDAHRGRR